MRLVLWSHRQLLRDRFGLTVVRSGLVHAVHRAARQYERLRRLARHACGAIRRSRRRNRVAGGRSRVWLWASVKPDTTAYASRTGAAFAQAARMLGAEYAGVQRAGRLGPLPPACPRGASDVPGGCAAPLPHDDAGPAVVSVGAPPGGAHYARSLPSGHCKRGRRPVRPAPPPALAARSSRLADVRRFAGRLDTEFAASLASFFDPTLDATNWRPEHAFSPP